MFDFVSINLAQRPFVDFLRATLRQLRWSSVWHFGLEPGLEPWRLAVSTDLKWDSSSAANWAAMFETSASGFVNALDSKKGIEAGHIF